MASISADRKTEKPSFAKIAAAGLKPSSVQQNPNPTENTQKLGISSSPRDGTTYVSPSYGSNSSAFTPKQKKLVPFVPKDSKETNTAGMNGPQVHVQNVDVSSASADQAPRALDGMLNPTTADEGGTQVSSSSGSAKPPSLDGKSVASGTTFALDEKESLRPDDSASVKATEDEDAYAPISSGLPGSRTGSDDEVQAFRDQLREISCMDPSSQSVPPQDFRHGSNHHPQGVLYVPPQGSGVGVVPGPARAATGMNEAVDFPPDPKLLEALESPKDRIMVLKLEQDIVDFVKDPKESSLKLPQTNAFYRMLAHKLADYYMLGHIVDEATLAVRIYKTPNCRLPPPLTGIATPSTAASTPPPMGTQMKILRRGVDNSGPAIANGFGVPSKTTSENGESGNDDEKRQKHPVSREEREARYEAARKRIMGSARPSESPEETVEVDNSRSSSAAEKKNNRRKQRTDSDDDFEARSAYYPAAFTPTGAPSNSYGFPNIVDSQGPQFQPSPMNAHDGTGAYQQYGIPMQQGWPNQGFEAHQGSSPWAQNQNPGYDLQRDFQRNMSFQPSPMAVHNPNMQVGYNSAYNQQYGTPTQPWQQPTYMPSYPQQPQSNYMQGYSNRPPSSSSFQDSQPYAFGQLPSQTFPGRPPNKLEHPIPGSYKGKHFNPQSQAFVPAQPNGANFSMYPTHGAPQSHAAYGSPYGMPSPQQWQNIVSPQQSAGYPVAGGSGAPRTPNQPMTHPLPQPVFPRQPSPNVPLPPKPEATPPKAADKHNTGPSIVSSTPSSQNQSSIAKWGTPASLPAKPPPAEPFDPVKFAQAQRQPSGANRQPNTAPNFGSMSPRAGGLGVNGQGVQSPRRS